MEGMMVAAKLRRNRKMTITTSAMVSISSYSTSLTEARMVTVRSVSTRTCTLAGRLVRSCGSNFWMRSTTAMMLAPGWRWIFTMTAGVRSIQAACCEFSAASTMVATSEARTAAPLR